MRRVLWLLPLLVVAGCKDETPRGAVKVTVTYQGFKPGCVLVKARDVASGQELSEPVQGKGGPAGGSLVVAVLPQEDWGTQVDVEAGAFERADCTGKEVVNRFASVTLTPGTASPVTLALIATDGDGDGYVSRLTGGTDCRDDRASAFPGAPELCNDVDDNCNDQSDAVELRLGQSCTNAQSCQGNTQCGAGGATVCSIPAGTTAYPDDDEDGRGRKDAEPTVFCNGVPARFTTGPADDCNDNSASVRPGAMERCNGTDDNCDGQQDEGFPQLGTGCTNSANQCAGTVQCNGTGTATACVVSQPIPTWYPDEDGDGYGQNPGSQTCARPAGTVDRGEDCDDGNPFRSPGTTEVCDGIDNNCDSPSEASGVCPAGGPRWAQRTVGESDQEWRSVFSGVPGGVGVVGYADARGMLSPGSNTFQTTIAGCGNNNSGWNALWVDEANNGRSYFGSVGGRLVYQDRTSQDCSPMLDIDRWVRGLVGIRNGISLELHGVTFNPADIEDSGSTFIWDGGSTLTYGTTPVAPLYDVHGVSRTALFAVGGVDSSPGIPGQRIYRFNATSGQWQTENVQTLSGLSRLDGVWVVNEKLAFAVGNSSSALRWNGTSWSKLPFPNNIESLTSVVAFGASSAYATAYNGRIYRYDGEQWTMVFEDTSLRLNDIAGTSPGDLWVVGENGVILHWPQWPQ